MHEKYRIWMSIIDAGEDTVDRAESVAVRARFIRISSCSN